VIFLVMQDQKKISADRKDFIKLDLNESYYLNTKILNKIKKIDAYTISAYPQYEELAARLAKYCNCEPEEILLTNGADQAIQILLRFFLKKGGKVVLPAPTFIVYPLTLGTIGVKSKICLYKDENSRFTFPFNEVMSSINKNISGILLCNPNNPLGAPIPKEQILAILKKAKPFRIPIIIDEAYYEFSGDTSAELLKLYKNLVIVRSFSKAFSMAGLRLGYILANKETTHKLHGDRLPFAVNHFAVHTGNILLERNSHFKDRIKESLEIKKDLIVFLRSGGIQCYDTSANFIVFKTRNNKKLIQKLKRAKILVKDMSQTAYGDKLLEGAIRMGIPSRADLKIVKNFFDDYVFFLKR